MTASPRTPAASVDERAQEVYDHARFLHAQALDNGWSLSEIHTTRAGDVCFVATDIPRGIEIQTELSRDDGLRSWRLEHRTQTKASDQVVAWFEQH